MTAPTTPLRHGAEQIAATLPPLLVAAERVAATVAQGVHGRRRVGQGETFWQFRDYAPGDKPSSIDWRQSAKSDRVFVRQTEWEAAQSVWLWRDASPSMAWHSAAGLPDKRERAELLALALIVLLLRAGEHVSLIGSGLPPAAGRGTVQRLSHLMTSEPVGGDGLPPLHPLPRHAQIVLFGDFLAPLEDVARRLRGFAERGVAGHLVQILDPAEEDLPYEGRVRFHGLENEGSWLLSRVQAVRPDYHRRLEAQRAGVADIARRAGWQCTWHRTDRPPQTALLAIYAALARLETA